MTVNGEKVGQDRMQIKMSVIRVIMGWIYVKRACVRERSAPPLSSMR